ncbi:Hypothetical_protein [Hexamita inflata]|uniref:Hypothetical_protein n=1 Tax=Hexamita inflata TaxID=28002 RepID=A0AA86NZB7_9EUKA|nr:Hypothetical protein HINF_LOCUS17112 [Hexamita inflata]CAI9929469.1 Hypothetical protein HINF_LOCUS17114 [Hexamita inflata]
MDEIANQNTELINTNSESEFVQSMNNLQNEFCADYYCKWYVICLTKQLFQFHTTLFLRSIIQISVFKYVLQYIQMSSQQQNESNQNYWSAQQQEKSVRLIGI